MSIAFDCMSVIGSQFSVFSFKKCKCIILLPKHNFSLSFQFTIYSIFALSLSNFGLNFFHIIKNLNKIRLASHIIFLTAIIITVS